MSAPARPLALGALTVLLAFFAGLTTGALLFGGDGDEANGPVTAMTPPALFDDLQLSPDQQQRIDSILGEMRRATDSLMDEARVDLTARATGARRAIEEVLTPEQQDRLRQRFDALGPMMVRRVRVNDSLIRVDTIQ